MKTVPLVFAWPEGVAFWLVYVWFSIPEFRVLRNARKMKANNTQDAGSIVLIMGGGQVSSILAFASAFLFSGATMVDGRAAVYWLGIILLVAAGVLRRHCFRMLGENFTGLVIVKINQPIIERGAYKWIRHPSYSAAFLMYLSLGLVLTNWISVAVLVLGATVIYSYRISVEERVLVETLGERYTAYQRRTKKLIPFLY